MSDGATNEEMKAASHAYMRAFTSRHNIDVAHAPSAYLKEFRVTQREVVEKLAHCNLGRLLVVEPHINRLPQRLELPQLQLEDFEVALKAANLVVLLVGHQAFLQVDRDLLKDKFVIDAVGAW